MDRRDFLKYTGAAGLLIASSDLVAELIAQSPKGNPMTSAFKGLSDVALAEAKQIGCTYADIRFTRRGPAPSARTAVPTATLTAAAASAAAAAGLADSASAAARAAVAAPAAARPALACA